MLQVNLWAVDTRDDTPVALRREAFVGWEDEVSVLEDIVKLHPNQIVSHGELAWV